MSNQFLAGYQLRLGDVWERSTLVKFLQLSYQELFPEQKNFSHLKETAKKYFSSETPLWWVELDNLAVAEDSMSSAMSHPIACLWLGNSVDQVIGDRHSYILLLYVLPAYRRQGIGSALMLHAETLARERGDRQIALQVFQSNQPALNLYRQIGYETQSIWMVKPLNPNSLE